MFDAELHRLGFTVKLGFTLEPLCSSCLVLESYLRPNPLGVLERIVLQLLRKLGSPCNVLWLQRS